MKGCIDDREKLKIASSSPTQIRRQNTGATGSVHLVLDSAIELLVHSETLRVVPGRLVIMTPQS